MLNKAITLLDDTGISTQSQLRRFLKIGDLKFAPAILDESDDSWKELIDLLSLKWLNDTGINPNEDWVDKRLANAFDLQVWETLSASDARRPKFSIVIPFRDRETTLRYTLDSIAKNQTDFPVEVVLVDDGSLAPPSSSFVERLRAMPFDHKLLRLSETDVFRAGFARNLGAIHARGPMVCFLDSDILLGPSFIKTICSELKSSRLVQAPRWQVWKSQWTSLEPTQSERLLVSNRDEPNPVWQDFNLHRGNWMAMNHPYRYVSSNNLSVWREEFLSLGGFRHWYSDYGFEDTDLGFRYWKKNLTLHRSSQEVFHLAPMERGERVAMQKTTLSSQLQRSARKFFLINKATWALDWLADLMV